MSLIILTLKGAGRDDLRKALNGGSRTWGRPCREGGVNREKTDRDRTGNGGLHKQRRPGLEIQAQERGVRRRQQL